MAQCRLRFHLNASIFGLALYRSRRAACARDPNRYEEKLSREQETFRPNQSDVDSKEYEFVAVRKVGRPVARGCGFRNAKLVADEFYARHAVYSAHDLRFPDQREQRINSRVARHHRSFPRDRRFSGANSDATQRGTEYSIAANLVRSNYGRLRNHLLTFIIRVINKPRS